jgi:hypothetical protein
MLAKCLMHNPAANVKNPKAVKYNQEYKNLRAVRVCLKEYKRKRELVGRNEQDTKDYQREQMNGFYEKLR